MLDKLAMAGQCFNHMRSKLLLILIAGMSYAQQAPNLPPAFKTTKGIEFKNAKISAQNGDSIKILHDGGIATIPHGQLPPEVLALLGISASQAPAENVIKLPDPLATAKNSYTQPELVAVEPDGIRIRHSLGSAKVRHEDLPQSVVDQVGPFDPKLAASFREAQAERDREAYATAQRAIQAAQQAETAAAAENNQLVEEHKQALLADPKLVSPSVAVEISASSTGGKSRDTDWATTWGSYSRTDVSERKMVCTVRSKISGYQRARIQCIFLTREVSGGKDLLYEVVANDLVSLGPKVTKAVGASAVAEQSDDRYAALGLRYRDGVKYVGWCWRAIDGQGRVCAVYSSTPAYDRYGWSVPVE